MSASVTMLESFSDRGYYCVAIRTGIGGKVRVKLFPLAVVMLLVTDDVIELGIKEKPNRSFWVILIFPEAERPTRLLRCLAPVLTVPDILAYGFFVFLVKIIHVVI